MEAAQKMVKQRSMEALDKLRTNVKLNSGDDMSRRSSTTSNVIHSTVNINSRIVGVIFIFRVATEILQRFLGKATNTGSMIL